MDPITGFKENFLIPLIRESVLIPVMLSLLIMSSQAKKEDKKYI